ncbi:MAG: FAD-dependent oxidoreductase [Oscillospiraceae bacterium]|nr:FAD-dependent oxidoreductase [Oscillospiraceae bacterium]
MQEIQTRDEINKLVEECLICKNPLCTKGCPIQTRIPEFISKIREDELEEAYNILQANNIMSDICSKICPVENQCMGKCIKGIKGQSVKINVLESFVNEWAKENNIEYEIKSEEQKHTKIAIIGGGPAGIACSVELAKKGIQATIFEKESELGGILRYGIPDFRLEKETLKNLIKKLEKLGVEIKTNSEFGKDITEKRLREEGYKAIFLGVGATKSSTYRLHEENDNYNGREDIGWKQGIYKADDFLKKYNKGESSEEDLGIVAVIGGGNVAMDAARVAVRLGASKVYILYRRDFESMPAREEELEDALREGVEIIYQTKVVGVTHKNGKIEKITSIRTRMEEGYPVDIPDSEFKMDANSIIFAIGIFPDKELFEKQGLKFDRALIEVDENQMTNIPGVFAGGDVIESKSSVCKAIGMGKAAARNIMNYI